MWVHPSKACTSNDVHVEGCSAWIELQKNKNSSMMSEVVGPKQNCGNVVRFTTVSFTGTLDRGTAGVKRWEWTGDFFWTLQFGRDATPQILPIFWPALGKALELVLMNIMMWLSRAEYHYGRMVVSSFFYVLWLWRIMPQRSVVLLLNDYYLYCRKCSMFCWFVCCIRISF